jgi:hypothetical protein
MEGLQTVNIAMSGGDSPDTTRRAQFGKFFVHDDTLKRLLG